MRFIILQIALAVFTPNVWSSASIIDVIKEAALKEYETGLTKQQQEDSKWVAKYFAALPTDVNQWDEFKFKAQGVPEDLGEIQAAFLLAYNKQYFGKRNRKVDDAIIKYTSPIFWRTREVVEVAPNISAAIVFHYIDTISNSDSIADLDAELAAQSVEAVLLNYQSVDEQLLLAIIDTFLEISDGELGILTKRIIREKILTRPLVFRQLVSMAYSDLKASNKNDGLSILSVDDINVLESAFEEGIETDGTYVYKSLNRQTLLEALRPDDWNAYPSFDAFLVKNFAELKIM